MDVQQVYRHVSQLYDVDSIWKFINEQNIDLSFYHINEDNHVILEQGNGNRFGESIMNRMLNNDIQGSYLDNQHFTEYTENPFILLSLREKLLPKLENELSHFSEMMTLHEIVHLIEQQKLQDFLGISLEESDSIIGKRIEKEVDKLADKQGLFVDAHNEIFGGILHYIIRKKYDKSIAQKMKIAMSKTLVETENLDFYII